jgi:CheY-like chemotaxis protein
VPKTLLAVDDSATMRKVLEITFGGEDFSVITADGRDSALAKLAEQPKVVLIDAALTGDGYALCQEIRKRDPNVTLVLLSSRYNPYDAAKGKDAGADDFMDKPFDTQAAIDKVRKAVLARESGAPVQAAAPAAAAAPAPAAAPAAAAAPPAAAAAAPAAKPAVPAAAAPVKSRSATLMFDSQVPAPKPMSAVAPQAAPHAAPPATFANSPVVAAAAAPAAIAHSAPAAAAPVHHSPAPTAVAAAVNGHLSTKLGDLGLTPAQADAVMALSREVVERIVWEVVPQLAEAIIKEEIARLTKEG